MSKDLSPSERRKIGRRGVLILKGRGANAQWKVTKQARDILEKKP